MTKFLVMRFAPGSAGKVLTGLLSVHPEISSWNRSGLDNLSWFKKSFTDNLTDWMDTEIQNPWEIKKYVSSAYPRGDDLNEIPIEFEDKWIPVIWHKNNLANFIKDYHVINICIDRKSFRWYHRSRWKKHFHATYENKKYKIYQLQHKESLQIRNFNNQFCVETNNLHSFIKTKVIDFKKQYNFLFEDKIKPSTNVNLSDLLEWNTTKKSLETISNNLELNEFDWNSVEPMWQHWRSCHNY